MWRTYEDPLCGSALWITAVDPRCEPEEMESPNPFEIEGEARPASGAYRWRKFTIPGEGTVAPQWLHSGSTVEIHGNPWIFGYFSGFLGYFLDFWSNIRVFGQNKVGIV